MYIASILESKNKGKYKIVKQFKSKDLDKIAGSLRSYTFEQDWDWCIDDYFCDVIDEKEGDEISGTLQEVIESIYYHTNTFPRSIL